MGRKRTPGLIKKDKYWHIDKMFQGQRIRKSCYTTDLAEAELVLARTIDEIRQTKLFGVRPKRTFEQAAIKYVEENQHKRSLKDDIGRLRKLLPHIGSLSLDLIHQGSLQEWIAFRKKEGVTATTINHGLQIVRRILNLAASEWLDENGLTWLEHAPKIKLLPKPNHRREYPLSWEEQEQLFKLLPMHLHDMALFAVNTGCRDAEICNLQWDWEVRVPELDTFVFLIPPEFVKNGHERLVVLNDIAKRVVESQRGNHRAYVFVNTKGEPVKKMLTSAWRTARTKAGLPLVRVHDLKHTYGRRLRAAGVGLEDRQDLLGHKNGSITTHYSKAELSSLIEHSNLVCERDNRRPELVVIRGGMMHWENRDSRKIPAMSLNEKAPHLCRALE